MKIHQHAFWAMKVWKIFFVIAKIFFIVTINTINKKKLSQYLDIPYVQFQLSNLFNFKATRILLRCGRAKICLFFKFYLPIKFCKGGKLKIHLSGIVSLDMGYNPWNFGSPRLRSKSELVGFIWNYPALLLNWWIS